LNSYLNKCNKENIPFRIICRHPNPDEWNHFLGRHKKVNFDYYGMNDLYHLVLNNLGKKMALSVLLKKYLEEQEMLYSEEIPSALNFLITRIYVYGSQNIRKTNDRLCIELGEAINKVNSNLSIINKNLGRDLKPRMWVFWQDIDFKSFLKIKNKNKQELINLDLYEGDTISSDDVRNKGFFDSGYIYFYSAIFPDRNINKGRIQFGYSLFINNKKKVTLSRYASLENNDPEDKSWEKENIPYKNGKYKLNNEENEVRAFKNLITTSIKQYVRYYSKKRIDKLEKETEKDGIKETLKILKQYPWK